MKTNNFGKDSVDTMTAETLQGAGKPDKLQQIEWDVRSLEEGRFKGDLNLRSMRFEDKYVLIVNNPNYSGDDLSRI